MLDSSRGKHVPSSSTRYGLWVALLLAGCAAVPGETVDSITAREAVLLEATSAFGIIHESDGDAVTWTDRGTLLLTPTTLYFVSGTTRSLSYAMVTSTSIRTLPDMLGFVRGRNRDNLLTVEVSRPVCQTACVFNLIDAPDLVPRAIEVMEAGRARVDPFGRADGPRPVWLAAGTRNSRFWWSEAPAYLESRSPERKRQLEEWFCARLDCRGRGSSGAGYGEGLREALQAAAGTGYQFRPLPGVVLNQRAELDAHGLANVLASEDPEVRALLVSDVTSVTLRERISAAYEVRIEVTVRSFVDYFDLDPLKDGRYFWSEFKTTRSLDDWLATNDSGFIDVLRNAARQTGCQVLSELNSHTDGTSSICPG